MKGICTLSLNRLHFTKQRCFSSCACPVRKILSFHWWKDIRHSEMKLLSKWPLTHHLYSQRSLTLTLLSSPPPHIHTHTFTCPCECSIYCNCIQHLALQTADKPAQWWLPTLVMLINRLFVQAYQSPYPPSLCGCLWTLCSLYINRNSLLLDLGL